MSLNHVYGTERFDPPVTNHKYFQTLEVLLERRKDGTLRARVRQTMEYSQACTEYVYGCDLLPSSHIYQDTAKMSIHRQLGPLCDQVNFIDETGDKL